MPYIPEANCSLLLHCNGANNGTTFVDDSPIGHTVSVFGGAKTVTDATALAGSCADFNGTDAYLSIPSHASLDCGTGLFTLAFRAFCREQPNNYPTYVGSGITSWTTSALGIRFDNTNDKKFSFHHNPNTPLVASSATYSTETWRWVHLIRDSSTALKLYVDGALAGSAAIDASRAFDFGANGLFVGRQYLDGANGYLSDRFQEIVLLKGLALHDAEFTPPTDRYSTALSTLSGTAVTSDGAGADSVLIRDWATRAHIATFAPNPTTGAWTGQVIPGTYDLTYLASGLAPVCHGPYTFVAD